MGADLEVSIVSPYTVQCTIISGLDQAQDPNNAMSNLVVNFISSNRWLSLLLRGIVSYKTMFENFPKDFKVEPAYGSNVSSNCALSSYLKNPCYPKLWYLLFHSLELPLL